MLDKQQLSRFFFFRLHKTYVVITLRNIYSLLAITKLLGKLFADPVIASRTLMMKILNQKYPCLLSASLKDNHFFSGIFIAPGSCRCPFKLDDPTLPLDQPG